MNNNCRVEDHFQVRKVSRDMIMFILGSTK